MCEEAEVVPWLWDWKQDLMEKGLFERGAGSIVERVPLIHKGLSGLL